MSAYFANGNGLVHMERDPNYVPVEKKPKPKRKMKAVFENRKPEVKDDPITG
jgi:hypothetical protein